ncbi:lipase precursor [Pyrenophora tritici-repentis]|nr:lipase precursor [Pyrenophora tritici-repentis]
MGDNTVEGMSKSDEERRKATMCSDIIQFKHAGNDSNYPNHQQARADPNQSLKEVFGIDNIFTNKTDKKKPFIEKVEKIMWEAMKANSFRDDGDWRDLRNQAIVFFDEYMKECDTELIKLAELTQFIVLKQSLWYLFESAQEALETSKTQFNDVKFIGRRINELWIQSKMTEAELDGAKPPIWSDEKDLHAALRRVTISKKTFDMPGMFPEDVTDDKPGDTTTLDPTKPTENPMNLLLPAYETMWRVVMRCFLEIKHRGAPNRSDWTAILRGYLEDLELHDS